MITTRPWPGISSPDWFINSDTPQCFASDFLNQIRLEIPSHGLNRPGKSGDSIF
jgi:hypothetical protein